MTQEQTKAHTANKIEGTLLSPQKFSLRDRFIFWHGKKVWALRAARNRFKLRAISRKIDRLASRSYLVDHMEREFKLLEAKSSKDIDTSTSEGRYEKLMRDRALSVIKLISAMDLRGAGNLPIWSLIERSMRGIPFSPLTLESDEWELEEVKDGQEIYKNVRDWRYGKIGSDLSKITRRGPSLLLYSCTKYVGESGKVEKGEFDFDRQTNSFMVLTKSGYLKSFQINHIKNGAKLIKDNVDLKSLTGLLEAYEVEHPEGWWMTGILDDKRLREIRKHFALTENKKNVSYNLSFKNNSYRAGMLKRLEAVGKDMYGPSFKLKTK